MWCSESVLGIRVGRKCSEVSGDSSAAGLWVSEECASPFSCCAQLLSALLCSTAALLSQEICLARTKSPSNPVVLANNGKEVLAFRGKQRYLAQGISETLSHTCYVFSSITLSLSLSLCLSLSFSLMYSACTLHCYLFLIFYSIYFYSSGSIFITISCNICLWWSF